MLNASKLFKCKYTVLETTFIQNKTVIKKKKNQIKPLPVPSFSVQNKHKEVIFYYVVIHPHVVFATVMEASIQD